ncbi:MAG: hypothetical protein ABIG84_00095 [archaeon]
MPFSRDIWEKTWKDTYNGLGSIPFIRQYGSDGQHYAGYNWINGREIRVFKEPKVAVKVVHPIVDALKNLIDEIGLDIQVNYFGNDSTLNRQIEKYTSQDNYRKVGGSPVKLLDGDSLSRELLTEDWRKYKPHADVIITDKYLKLGTENWGQSQFSLGTEIISLPDRRQDALEFIYNISKHEGEHLIGYNQHHDSNKVTGYKEPSDCLMYWKASTDRLCNKCKNATVFFWEGAKDRMNDTFFEKQPILILQ